MRELSAAPAIALDTEGDSLHHYPERLALIQIGVPDGSVWLVDPLALPDLDALAPLFAEPARLLVLHAGDNDLVHLKRRWNFKFGAVFDTAIAGRFLGGRALGLDVLLDTYLGVALPPSRQKDDWSKRPLTDAQTLYAASDVQHLFALRTRLHRGADEDRSPGLGRGGMRRTRRPAGARAARGSRRLPRREGRARAAAPRAGDHARAVGSARAPGARGRPSAVQGAGRGRPAPGGPDRADRGRHAGHAERGHAARARALGRGDSRRRRAGAGPARECLAHDPASHRGR